MESPVSDSTNNIAPTLLVPECPLSVPVWVPVIVGISSLLAGLVVAWLILSCIQGRKNKVERPIGMKGTGF